MRITLVALILVLGLASVAPAQKSKPTHYVKGTTQLAGDNGKIGVTYTIGKSESLNITLLEARFTLNRFNSSHDAFAPGKDEKVLLITYTIQNPNHVETEYSGRMLKFTAVDPNDENHEFVGSVVRKDGLDEFNTRLKPAQKVAMQTAIIVPAKGPIPKLMVQHRDGGAVLRYNLKDAVKGLDKPFAGETSADALPEVPAVPDTYYPMFYYDVKYLSNTFQDGPFSIDSLPEKKMIFFIPKFQVKLVSGYTRSLRIRGDVQTEDGDSYTSWGPFKAGSEQDGTAATDFGQEMGIRLVFKVPKGSHIVKMRVWENQGPDSHYYVFPLDVKAPNS